MESTGHSEVRRRVEPLARVMSADGVDLDEMALTLSAVLQPDLKLSCERRGDLGQLALVMQARDVMPEFVPERDDAARALAILNRAGELG